MLSNPFHATSTSSNSFAKNGLIVEGDETGSLESSRLTSPATPTGMPQRGKQINRSVRRIRRRKSYPEDLAGSQLVTRNPAV